jgi:hypothetical protein
LLLAQPPKTMRETAMIPVFIANECNGDVTTTIQGLTAGDAFGI